MHIFDKIISIIYPAQCGVCGKLGTYICDNCLNEIQKYEIEKQNKDIFFVYKYEGLIRKLIIDYKFNDKSYLYKTFADILLKNKKLCNFLSYYDIIVAVPLHKKRLLERGYNQAELIVNELTKKVDITQQNNILFKTKNVKPQSTKNVKARIDDVKGIFKVENEKLVVGKNILIFDDIYTTGSTANECKYMLEKAGAKKVGILTLAKDYIN